MIPTLSEADSLLAYVSLKHFVTQLWKIVEPREFVDGWHIECICDHLEAVSAGEIEKVIFNVPPRHSKSLLVSVMWPMWDWLKHPERQWLCTSYAEKLSIRDSRKSRNIFRSRIYQELLMQYQPDLYLVGDQNQKIRFENSANGYRLATSVDGTNTGEGGDIIVIDDPNNVREGESETKRESVNNFLDEVIPTRRNDPESGGEVIIQQRTHEDDATGHILSKHDDWIHVCLPARYEGKCMIHSPLDWEDPRVEIDEPLCPERYSDKSLSILEKRLGSYATAGQLQQRPAPRGGGMIKTMDVITAMNRTRIVKSVRYWDKAGTQGGGARTAGVLMHLMKDDTFVIEDVVTGQWEYAEREKKIEQTAHLDAARFGGDRAKFETWTEQEPGSSGKESADRTIRHSLRGFKGYKEPASGDKVTRAGPWSAGTEAGLVKLLQGEWNPLYISETQVFPFGKYKDQSDATSGAFNKLNDYGNDKKKKTGGTFGSRTKKRKPVMRKQHS